MTALHFATGLVAYAALVVALVHSMRSLSASNLRRWG